MKKNLFKVIAVLGVAFLVISCGKDKPVTSESNEVLTQTDGVLYKVDTMNSRVEWKGYKVLKTDQTTHFGTIRFESGDVTIKEGKLQSGKFVADINTLENIDLKDKQEMKTKLESHLKSGDFFEVEKFPTASYEITKVTEANGGDYNTLLDGNLTIKGITKPVQFKANVTVADGNVNIATEPTDINREDFGLKFTLPLENGLLNKEINLQVLIKAMESK
jgi:polyisoprenoid-binding protein YceI